MQQTNERIAEEVLILAVVKAPRHLLQVGGKMLHRNLMPRAHYATLEQRERGFDRVRRDAEPTLVPDVLLGLVIHRLVFAVVLRGFEVVELRFVGHDDIDGLVHVSRNDLVDFVLIQIAGRDEVQVTAALTNADDWRVLLPLVRVLGVATDVHLVNFNRAFELMVRLFHGLADAVTEIPRGLVGDAEHSLNLVCGDAFARFGNQVRDEKPFRQRQVRVMKDRADRHRELVAA